MKTWMTADTHFGHANVIEYSHRPYATLSEMDADLARRWNEVVGPDDLVYHLGDFAMGDPEKWPKYRSRLNGRIVLVRGNHDRYLGRVVDRMALEDVVENAVVDIDGVRAWLNHYPPTPDYRGRLHRPAAPAEYDIAFCGHVHNAWKCAAGVVNVGIDVWDYRPISVAAAVTAKRPTDAGAIHALEAFGFVVGRTLEGKMTSVEHRDFEGRRVWVDVGTTVRVVGDPSDPDDALFRAVTMAL